MMKKTCILMIILMSLFLCAFDAVFDTGEEIPESSQTETGSEIINFDNEQENIETEIVESVITDENTDPVFDDLTEEQQNLLDENTDNNTEMNPLPGDQESVVTIEPELESNEEPAAPTWMDIDEDQVNILYTIYSVMTDNGKSASGWFSANDYAPCTWRGVSCEAGRVTALTFENTGFFALFPEEILALRDLKELHMIDTLVSGPLPEMLFKDLPKLEVLELKGNFLTGEIPALPEAFAYYPMLREITLSDNLDDDRKTQMLRTPDYLEIYLSLWELNQSQNVDLTPGLDGTIPDNWNTLPLLSEIDLSGNHLTGSVPDSFASLPLAKLDLRDNAEPFNISQELYDWLVSLGNPEIILDGIWTRFVKNPDPAVEPTEESAEIFIAATEVVQETPSGLILMQPDPTEVPTEVPAQVSPTPQTIFIVVTATPEPRYYTSTPAPRYFTATPQPYYYPQNPQPYYYPTATPYYYQPQPYYYPTATPYYYQPQPYYYPTATPYTNYNPNWVYPTATSVYQYPQYVQNQQSPTQAPTVVPTQDPAAMLGFTYKLEAMTENNIPMTWRYTGMTEYSINYLDPSGNLYPAFAMEWTQAADVCNASACNVSVSVPDDLLSQGKFSLQLRARDASGKIYMSDPVTMEVSIQQPTPTPVPEQPKSFLGGFFEWLFGPLIRLFGGK